MKNSAKAALYRALNQALTISQIKELIEGVEIASKSPYSDSFYSATNISWGHKPDGSYRISDHWNFFSRGEMHCETSNNVEDDCWSVGVYSAETGKYTILKSFKKDFTAFRKKVDFREENRKEKLTARQEKIKEIVRNLEQRRWERNRALRIKNKKIWVSVNVNVWSGSGRNVKFAGTEDLVGRLVWESKTGNSFQILLNDGSTREIRKYNSYQELKRKPYTRKNAKAAA
ncbi:hypothetical protein [Cruoricaptor ignavus]|nr:hypothetical protein [Cruoricaptor ignavus]